MSVYFFDLRDGECDCDDEEGIELAELESVHARALEGIRDLMSSSVRRGFLSLDGRIEVRDAAGLIVLTVPFAEAVTLSGCDARPH